MINTECGIFAVLGNSEVSSDYVFKALGDLQHRGRESFGACYVDGSVIKGVRASGEVVNLLKGHSARSWLSHVRYSTSGGTDLRKTQPLISGDKTWSIAHNGNIPEMDLEVSFSEGDSDTQKLCFFMETRLGEGWSLERVLRYIINKIPLAYSLVIQTTTGMYLMRDRHALRPLGYIRRGGSVVVASENWALDGDFVDVKAGQLLFVDGDSLSINTLVSGSSALARPCVFEYIYFLRGKSTVDSINANHFRNNLGRILGEQLREESPGLMGSMGDSAVICGVPSSGIKFGMAIAETLNLEYSQFLTKRPDYPYRTFILKNPSDRLEACKRKFQAEPDLIGGKVIILVDDSIVRGTTLKFLIKFLKLYEPAQIHFISGSPPVKHPCYYGMDFPDIEDLVANRISPAAHAAELEIDSLTYLKMDRLKVVPRSVGYNGEMCDACFTGNYLK